MGTVELLNLLDVYSIVTCVIKTVRDEPAAIGGAENCPGAHLVSYSMGSGSSSS